MMAITNSFPCFIHLLSFCSKCMELLSVLCNKCLFTSLKDRTHNSEFMVIEIWNFVLNQIPFVATTFLLEEPSDECFIYCTIYCTARPHTTIVTTIVTTRYIKCCYLPSSSANMLVMETEVRREDRASSDIRCDHVN